MNVMKTVVGDNELSTLTITNLKTCVNAEHNALMKAIKQVALENYKEGYHNRFCQFVHDGATLKNKDKCQAMGVQFAGKHCEHNNVIALLFRKLDTHASGKVSELAQKACNEIFGLVFHYMFSCSVQDLSVSAVAKELKIDKVECDVHQGDKVGASAVGELVRTVNKVSLLFIHIVVVAQCFNFDLMYFL